MLHAEDRWARKVSGTKCASLTRWLLYKGADHFIFSTVDAGDFLSEFWGIGQLLRFEPLLIIVWLVWGASLKCFFGSELSSHDTAGNWLRFSRRRARWLVEGIPEWDAKAFVSPSGVFPWNLQWWRGLPGKVNHGGSTKALRYLGSYVMSPDIYWFETIYGKSLHKRTNQRSNHYMRRGGGHR